MEMILRAIGVQGGTRIVPSHTFIASATAAIHAGAKVIFVDCQRENFQMDPQDVRRQNQTGHEGRHAGTYERDHFASSE
jgi:dTDP-4-amino-4,6-dideoxygalactose transaminase